MIRSTIRALAPRLIRPDRRVAETLAVIAATALLAAVLILAQTAWNISTGDLRP